MKEVGLKTEVSKRGVHGILIQVGQRIALGAFLLTLAACAGWKKVSLQPVPYVLEVPKRIADRLSTGPIDGEFGREVEKAGALAAGTVYFTPADGTSNQPRSILMTAFVFPEAKFDAAQRPDEPPPFGRAVIRDNGKVLSIAGPHDTIYDPDTPAGRDVVWLAGRIYNPESYSPSPR